MVVINSMNDAHLEIERLKEAERATGEGSLSVEDQVTILSKKVSEIGESLSRLGKSIGPSRKE
jgi:hypothetical protein